jgi:hypothetical protein
MVAVGFSYCLSALIVATESWAFIFGLHLIGLPYAILFHILLAFPSGRLETRAHRLLAAATTSSGADPAGGSGLRGLDDRVAALEGSLEVESPPGGGTTVHAVIPLPPGAVPAMPPAPGAAARPHADTPG